MNEWGIEPEVVKEQTIPAVKKPNIWEIMNSAFDKKFYPKEEELESINEFLFHKLLTRFEETVPLALMLDTKDIPVKHQYVIVREFLPKIKLPFVKQTKKTSSKDIENIMRYYNCNERIAKEYLALMPKEEIQRINDKFKTGKLKGNK